MRIAAVVAAILLSLLANPSFAQHADADKARARDAFKRGMHAYDFGEYQKALDAFKEAYAAYEDPGFLYNIAQCHRQLGQNEDAVRVYRSYLRNAKNPPNVDEVQVLIAKLEQQLADDKAKAAAEAPPPTVTTPPPATVEVATAPPPPVEQKPVYKKGWFWGAVVGGVVVVGAAVALGVVFGTRSPANPHASIASVDGN